MKVARYLMISSVMLLAHPAAAQMSAEVRVPGGVMPAGTVVSNDPADQLALNLRILAQNPRDVFALTQAGESALAVGDANAAISFLARAEQLSPSNARVKASLAAALVMLERPSEAIRIFAEAEALGVSPATLARNRGLAYDLLGDQRRAQYEYSLALRSQSDDETIRRLALSYGISGDKDRALRMLEPLIRKQDQAAWRARSFILAMNGDTRGAERIAEQVASPSMLGQLSQFYRRLATLSAAERASAVNFGTMPSDGTTRFASAAEDGTSFRPMSSRAGEALVTPPQQVAQAFQGEERNKRRERRRPGRVRDIEVALASPPTSSVLANASPTQQDRPTPAWRTSTAVQPRTQPVSAQASRDAALLPATTRPVPISNAPLPNLAVQPASTASVRSESAPVFEVPPAASRVQQAPVPIAPQRPMTVPASASPALIAASAPLRVVGPLAPPPAQQSISAGQTGLAVRPATAPVDPVKPVAPAPSAAGPALVNSGPINPAIVPAAPQVAVTSIVPASTAPVANPPVAVTPPTPVMPQAAVAQPVASVAPSPAPIGETQTARVVEVSPPVTSPSPVVMPATVAPPASVAVPAPAQSVPAPVAPVPVAPAPAFTFSPTPPALPASAAPTVAETARPTAPPVAAEAPLTPAISPVSPAGPAPVAISSAAIAGPTRAEAGVSQLAPPLQPEAAGAAAPTEPTPTAPVPVAVPPAPVSAPAGLGDIVAGLEVENQSAAVPVMSDAEFRRARLAARRRADEETAAQAAAKAEEDARRVEEERTRAEAARHPARIWVQVATGANRGGLPITWKHLREQAPDALQGMSASTIPFHSTNRLLIGPFKSQSEARSIVNRLSKAGVSATTYASNVGDEVTRVSR